MFAYSRNVKLAFSVGALLLLAATAVSVVQAQAGRSITVITEPKASVWVDGVYFGRADETGRLLVKKVSAGNHSLRVRADGFREVSKPLTTATRGDVTIKLVQTNDEAELAFQEAGRLTSVDREKAAAAYRTAISKRPNYTAAYLELARVLLDAQMPDDAAAAIRQVKKISPRNAEASAIEGRINKENGDYDKAIASYKRAIVEGRGFQPEAYTGLGLLYKERAEGAGGEGDAESEAANYAEAAKNLKIALKQLSGAPDASVLYQLLGLIYERQKKYPEAISVYEEFLQFFPDTADSTAVRSFIIQLKKQMNSPD
jgi:tetratricopeptide (TPR) repeat protein